MILGARLRLGFTIALAAMTGGCQPPQGIYRTMEVDGEVDMNCIEKAVLGFPGLEGGSARPPYDANSNPSPGQEHWLQITYRAEGLSDVLDTLNVVFQVSHSGDPPKATISHSFERNSEKRVSNRELKDALGVMKGIEARVGSACGINFSGMKMACGPSLQCEKLT